MRSRLFWLGLISAMIWPACAAGHLIDEIAQSIVIDLATKDRANFRLTYALHRSHVEAFYRQARQLGIAPHRSDEAFAEQLSKAFLFRDCEAKPTKDDSYAPKPGFKAWVLQLRCKRSMSTLHLTRVDYERAKTRTTLFIGARVAGQPLRRFMLPPRLPSVELQLAAPTGTVDTGPREKQQSSHIEREQHRDTDYTLPPPEHPDPQTARRSRTFAWLVPPPAEILAAWALEGAQHLAFGADHLLFLLALTLCAARGAWLIVAVMLFSVGHIIAMGVALAWKLPGHAAIEVAVGLSIAWAGWRARRPTQASELTTGGGVLCFGLVHGWAFGSELGRLVLAVDGVLWPLASFGVGLDLSQLAWCGLCWLAVCRLRRFEQLDTRPGEAGPLAKRLAAAVSFGGVAFALVAIY